MGWPFNESGPGAATDATGLRADAVEHRRILGNALRAAGFVNYGYEWWHWSYGDRLWAYLSGEPRAVYGPLSVDVRVPFDLTGHEARARTGPCFVCAFLSSDPAYAHELVYEDADTVAFLSRYPTLPGYTIVAPRRHVAQVTGDLSKTEYGRLQSVVYDISEALKRILPVERVHLLSLGSNQGNAHVHWHVAPLPPGVPYDQQQYHALMAEHGVLDQTPEERAALAARIRAELSER